MRPLYELVSVIGDLAAARFELGDRDAARELFANALGAFVEARRPAGHAVLEGYASLARVAFASYGRDGTAADLAAVRQILSLLRRYCRVFPIGHPQHSLWRGRLARLLGDERSARSTWSAGLDRARHLGMGHEALVLSTEREGGRPEVAPTAII